ncbi:MAG: cysteine hydrolase family protein [Kiritimatiellae bacterium]|nr:cysteine hydrolase family protein [Kiritimatiellia bacterium]
MNGFPSFYDPKRVGGLAYPNLELIAQEAGRAGLRSVEHDTQNVQLLLIDMQVAFCHERSSLYVPGAQDDVRRVIEFIYRNAERISQITCSQDSHYPFQIFHAAWWADAEGNQPPPFTIISMEDVESQRWRPLRDVEWSREYVQRLEAEAKKQLTIWPYHAMLGSMGHSVDPELWSAIFWHALARKSQPAWWRKGSVPRTEHYSILRPEIHVTGHPQGGLNTDFVDALDEYDFVVIAGEASSHCVLESVSDMVEVFRHTPEKLDRIFILRDCMSPLRHPNVDFEAHARAEFARYEKQGVRFINSTDPLPF